MSTLKWEDHGLVCANPRCRITINVTTFHRNGGFCQRCGKQQRRRKRGRQENAHDIPNQLLLF